MSYTWTRITGSNKVSNTPGYIGSIIATSDSDSKVYIIVYDGESSGDPIICTIRGLAGETKQIIFSPPLKTQRGLYVYMHGDTEEVLIQHSWGPE